MKEKILTVGLFVLGVLLVFFGLVLWLNPEPLNELVKLPDELKSGNFYWVCLFFGVICLGVSFIPGE